MRCDGVACGYNATLKRPPSNPDPVDIALRPTLTPGYFKGDCRKCNKTVIKTQAELDRLARAHRHEGGPN